MKPAKRSIFRRVRCLCVGIMWRRTKHKNGSVFFFSVVHRKSRSLSVVLPVFHLGCGLLSLGLACPCWRFRPYMYLVPDTRYLVCVIGVGDRKKNDGKHTSRFFGFFFLRQPKHRLKKVSFWFGETEKNRPKKTTFGFRFTTLENILRVCSARGSQSRC